MSHKYDEFFRNLSDAAVVVAVAVREAERLGLKRTLDDVKDMYNGLVEIKNNVMTKIEAEHAAAMLDGEKSDQQLRREFLAQTAGMPPRGIVPQVAMFPPSAAPHWPCPGQVTTATFKKEAYFEHPTDPEGPPGPEAAGAVDACTETPNPTEGD